MVNTRSNSAVEPAADETSHMMDTSEATPQASATRTWSLQELRQLVQTAESRSPLLAGETWYIISAKWYAQLKSHLAEGAGNETTNPGSVDNGELIMKFEEQNELREGAVEKADYDFIPEDLWTALIRTFGGSVNDQTLVVRTYENQLLEIKIETRPLALNCCFYPKIAAIAPVHVSRSTPIYECLKILLAKFDLSSKDNVRFWVFSPDGSLEMPKSEGEKPVAELDLTIKHLIVVERIDGDAWPLDASKNKDKLLVDLKKHQNDSLEAPPGGADSSQKESPYYLRSSHGVRDSNDALTSGTQSRIVNGLVGLGNLGNTCFMNSSLQCLSNIPELTNYFRSKNFEKDINVANPLGKKGEIAKVYADLVDELWRTNSSGSVYPSKFKGTLSRHTSLFNGAQQDAQESLQYIVDCLHEDLNRVKKKPYVPAIEDEAGKSDQELAEETWRNFLARNDSVVVDLFHGQIRSSVKCPDCDKLSVTFDPVCYYSLPLPTNQMKKLSYTLVPYVAGCSPSRQKIMIPKNVNVGEFLKRVSEQVMVAAENLIAVTIYDFRVTLLKKDKGCEEFTDRDRIFVYQTAKPVEDPNYVSVMVYVRKLKEPSKYSTPTNTGTLCDYPFVVTLSSKGIPAKMLYHQVFSKLGRRLVVPDDHGSVKKSSLGDDDEDVDELTVDDIESSVLKNGELCPASEQENSMDENMEEEEEGFEIPAGVVAAVPSIFTISTINSYGSVENKRIKNAANERVTFPANRDGHFISVNLTEDSFRKFYKESNMPPEEDKFTAVSSGRTGQSEVVDLRDCFQLFTSPERLVGNNMWRCPNCKEDKPAMKKLDFWKMPKYMFVHLKRFQYNRFYREKLSTKVRFPVKGLDLSDLIMNPADIPAMYDLVGVSCHSGGLGGGHYWAVCRNKDDGEWYKFDDSRVNPATGADIENETNPYILVFKRQSDGVHNEGEEDHSIKMEE